MYQYEQQKVVLGLIFFDPYYFGFKLRYMYPKLMAFFREVIF